MLPSQWRCILFPACLTISSEKRGFAGHFSSCSYSGIVPETNVPLEERDEKVHTYDRHKHHISTSISTRSLVTKPSSTWSLTRSADKEVGGPAA